jgi:hypothetical protein
MGGAAPGLRAHRAFLEGAARPALTGIGGDARLVPLVASGLPLMSIVVPFGK